MFWGGGGLPRGLGHNLLVQFSSLGSSKIEISETGFFDTLTTQNDQISDEKHVLAPLYEFLTLFGWWGGGGSQGGWGITNTEHNKYRPNSKVSRNPNFCVGGFELIISKNFATASKMGKNGQKPVYFCNFFCGTHFCERHDAEPNIFLRFFLRFGDWA